MLKYNNRKIKAKIHLVSKVCPSKPVGEKGEGSKGEKRKKRREKIFIFLPKLPFYHFSENLNFLGFKKIKYNENQIRNLCLFKLFDL